MRSFIKTQISKFGAPTLQRFCTSSTVNQHKESERKSTVDAEEVKFFSKLKDEWWDVNGKTKTLHKMNPLRVKFVKDGLSCVGLLKQNSKLPFEGIKLLDVGCGGGILTETLGRLGADVIGLDASKELISVAKEHAAMDKSLSSRLTYVDTLLEEFAVKHKDEFDAVVASEIIEHVNDQDLFVKNCTEVLKPNGSIFVTTMNKNTLSWLVWIVAAEYILKRIPKGTHDPSKFISPDETEKLLNKYNCRLQRIHGMFYNPLTVEWNWTPSIKIHYALHAIKENGLRNK